WPRCGESRRRSAGTSRTRCRSPMRSASCCLTTPGRSAARSSMSTAGSTPSALQARPELGGALRSLVVEAWLGNDRVVRVSALLGALTIAFSSILVRLSHASPSTAAIFRCLFALPVLGLLAWGEDRRFGGRGWSERRVAVAAGL